MELIKCLLVNNDCCKAGDTMRPRGVMVHSTGANNPNLRRYVQPVAGQENYSGLIAALGKNTNGNHWNRGGVAKCVHAFIGKLADGSIATVQNLPWEVQAWHCAGSANGTHISFEICESDLEDYDYFKATYKEAVAFVAHLCELYGLDPMAPGVVIGHGEGYKLGVASNRSVSRDPWFGPFGYSMDGFRRDVKDIMGSPADCCPLGGGGANPAPESGSLGDGGGKADSATTKKEDENMTGEEIVRRINEYTATLPAPDWAQAELKEAVELGITDGTNPMGLIPRYQAALMAKRAVDAVMGRL